MLVFCLLPLGLLTQIALSLGFVCISSKALKISWSKQMQEKPFARTGSDVNLTCEELGRS